ncbi:hypothetical protein Syun_016307 [Stephania yunnanensis]|uniref:Protein kinase domain-containing protein n=1 Tax=Stephania yunnanensis TaxID=152371 RepID=A0AAP0P3R9_9MAGN
MRNGTSSSRLFSLILPHVAIPTVIGAIFFIAVVVYLLIIRKREKKAKMSDADHEMGNGESLQFDLDMIKVATGDFSSANKLGEGGFGAVYKGALVDGQEIAVKRLSVNSGQGSQEFKNEVVLLNKLQHRNLVRWLRSSAKKMSARKRVSPRSNKLNRVTSRDRKAMKKKSYKGVDDVEKSCEIGETVKKKSYNGEEEEL